MGWRRLGQLYCPSGNTKWACSHAALPVVIHLQADQFRIFFSARDANNRSSIGWVDFELSYPPRVLAVGQSPALTFGMPGSFDDSGAGIGSIVRMPGEDRLYYMGWNLGVVAPWRNSIGVAVGNADTAQFKRLYEGPILDRSPEDPYTISYPWVLRLSEGEWRMWYGSNTKWGASASDMFHVIKTAHSSDGLVWRRSDVPVLSASLPGEYALARPAVLHEAGRFRMWFAGRGDHYQILYAESADGAHWERMDEVCGLPPNCQAEWESEMTCYPCPFRHKGRLYLAYNGNGYGRSGIGLAVWE